jgi:hypothetical protein
LNNKQTAFGVEEKERQRNFNDNKLDDIANANMTAVKADQPGQRKDYYQRQQKVQELIQS